MSTCLRDVSSGHVEFEGSMWCTTICYESLKPGGEAGTRARDLGVSP